jgi:hypothetical protein
MTAGGGFAYVGAMHDSFPQALELSKMGYNAFALIYRPDDPYRDLAQAITYIYDHAAELEVDPGNYSLWGGSAGARMAATLGNAENLRTLTARTDIPQAANDQIRLFDMKAVYRVSKCICIRCTHIRLCWDKRQHCQCKNDAKSSGRFAKTWNSHRIPCL